MHFTIIWFSFMCKVFLNYDCKYSNFHSGNSKINMLNVVREIEFVIPKIKKSINIDFVIIISILLATSTVRAGDAAASPGNVFWAKFGQTWAKVIKIWTNLIKFRQNPQKH